MVLVVTVLTGDSGPQPLRYSRLEGHFENAHTVCALKHVLAMRGLPHGTGQVATSPMPKVPAASPQETPAHIACPEFAGEYVDARHVLAWPIGSPSRR